MPLPSPPDLIWLLCVDGTCSGRRIAKHGDEILLSQVFQAHVSAKPFDASYLTQGGNSGHASMPILYSTKRVSGCRVLARSGGSVGRREMSAVWGEADSMCSR